MSCCGPLIAELRKHGYRLTPQREMVVEAVAHAGQHVSAEEVFELVRARSSAVNIATVYRTLELLAELGLASRTDLGGGTWAYASQLHGPHCHLVCRRCHQVIEADCEALGAMEESLRERHGFIPDLGHFVVYGLCQECQAASN
jgi:Fur family transcriptional regulator, ferric uptake regulator